MKLYRILTILILFFSFINAQGQFYVNGDDPGNKRWMQIQTDKYKIIYPEEIDSLAHVYARNLERYRLPVSFSTKYSTGDKVFLKKKMPVVLHAWNAFSNGSVAWAPQRMDLYTIPTPYSPDAIPWTKMLSIHESRHITQMQFGLDSYLFAGDVWFGEMFNILMTILYTGTAYMEGDAVITETALTKGGRGRRADFLNYYMLAFDQGIKKNWRQWKEQSQRHYTPNHYALGYLTLGGYRYRWDDADIMKRYYDLIYEKPYRFNGITHLMEKHSGMKFKHIFQEICDTVYTDWKKDADNRKPYISGKQVTKSPKIYTNYSDLVFAGNKLYAIKRGFEDDGKLMEIKDNGKEKTVTKFAREIGLIYHSPTTDRIYWSETVPDKRWSLKAESRLRYMDLDKNKRKYNLTKKGLLYNPVPSPTENHIAATEYFVKGGSRIAILNGKTGEKEHWLNAPDTLQTIEPVWLDDKLYASALSDNGYGIYMIDISQLNEHDKGGNKKPSDLEQQQICTTSWNEILAPQSAIIQNLASAGDKLIFSSDRSGVNEFYSLDVTTREVRQLTSTRYGVCQGTFSPDFEEFYYTAPTLDGNMIYKISSDSLFNKSIDYSQQYKYPIAEKLTEQENKLKEENEWIEPLDEEIEISKPKRFRKALNFFNTHSWAPFYLDVKNIMNLSADHYYDLASLGITGISQNLLSTAYGHYGYSAHKDPYDKSKWRHSGHFKFTYSGLYPVFELSLDVNDRAALQYRTMLTKNNGTSSLGIIGFQTKDPYVKASIKTYIPFNFSSGGWNRGFIPQFSYTFTNDRFDSKYAVFDMVQHSPMFEGGTLKGYSETGKNQYTHEINLSARFYNVASTPNSCVYPQWGIGIELGGNFDLNKNDYFSHMGFAYLYGYIPGFVKKQGFRLSALYQHNFANPNKPLQTGRGIVNLMPRGLSSHTDVLNLLSQTNKHIAKFTIDYGIPIYIGDINIWKSFISIKRLEVNPHFDFMIADKKNNLWSAGVSAIFKLNTLIWIPWPFSLGVTYSYNGGSLFKNKDLGSNLGHHFVGPILNVTF